MEKSHHASLMTHVQLLKWRDVYFNQSEKGIKSKTDIKLILTNHYFYAQNLSVKDGENNSVLAGVPFLSPSRAPKFPLPRPLSTPATQATLKVPDYFSLNVKRTRQIRNTLRQQIVS